MLENFHFDFWTALGLFGQFIFFMRFVVQWWASEKAGRSVLPMSFWYFSVLGTVILLVYGWQRQDLVILVGFSLALVIYARNIVLVKREKKNLPPA